MSIPRCLDYPQPPIAACHSQSMWYDLHGTISAGMGPFGNLLDQHSAKTSPRRRISHPSAGPLPLAPASNPEGAAQDLQSKLKKKKGNRFRISLKLLKCLFVCLLQLFLF